MYIEHSTSVCVYSMSVLASFTQTGTSGLSSCQIGCPITIKRENINSPRRRRRRHHSAPLFVPVLGPLPPGRAPLCFGSHFIAVNRKCYARLWLPATATAAALLWRPFLFCFRHCGFNMTMVAMKIYNNNNNSNNRNNQQQQTDKRTPLARQARRFKWVRAVAHPPNPHPHPPSRQLPTANCPSIATLLLAWSLRSPFVVIPQAWQLPIRSPFPLALIKCVKKNSCKTFDAY